MNEKSISNTFLIFLLILLITKIPVLTGCANIIPPSGGPRDSLPPVLIKATPVDSARNFTGNRITFTFDEFVDLQNIYQNLIVSPIPKSLPDVQQKLKTITVRIKDTLEPNTTYSLNFGDAIKDYNEGNVLKNFTYIFSTGNTIDSLELKGKVVLAETGSIDSTLIVLLYKNGNDSSVVKEKPRYIGKLDNKGNFVFHNLPAGTFYLYALKADGGRNYTDKKQLFAFADKPVVISPSTAPDTVYAYSEISPRQILIPQLTTPGRKISSGTADKRLRFTTNLLDNKQDLLNDLIISFEQPLRLFDSSKIKLSSDSVFNPVNNYHWEKDSTGKKIRLITPWKENTVYHLVFDKDFSEDSLGRKLLKTDTLTFTVRNKNEYGKLSIRFRNLDLSTNPILLFVQNNEVKRSFPLTSADFSQSLFLPGDYELRILKDSNKNGKWDPGEFFGKHKQPEIVKPIDRKITIKPNWENEFEIAL